MKIRACKPQKYFAVVILSVAGFGITPVFPKDINNEFVAFGAGANNCADFLQARRIDSQEHKSYQQWLSGYLSAFNLIVVNTYDIAGNRDNSEIVRWLDQYCSENQEHSFIDASTALTIRLYPERINLAPGDKARGNWSGAGQVLSVENPTRQ